MRLCKLLAAVCAVALTAGPVLGATYTYTSNDQMEIIVKGSARVVSAGTYIQSAATNGGSGTAATLGGNNTFTGTNTFNSTLNSSTQVITGAANTAGETITGGSTTGSGTQGTGLAVTGTLNTSGVVPGAGINVAITDTAHGAGSTLVGVFGGASATTSEFKVDTSGNGTFNGSMTTSNVILAASGAFTPGGTNAAVENVTPTCTAQGGSPTCTVNASNGSLVMKITLGSAGSVTTITITPGYTAANAWYCTASDATTSTERLFQNTALSNTTSILTFFNAAGTATSPGASDVIIASCVSV